MLLGNLHLVYLSLSSRFGPRVLTRHPCSVVIRELRSVDRKGHLKRHQPTVEDQNAGQNVNVTSSRMQLNENGNAKRIHLNNLHEKYWKDEAP